MDYIGQIEEAKLFTAILSGDEGLFDIVKEKLTSSLGPIEMTTPVRPWTYTSYYEKEMGCALKRIFLFFSRSVPLEILPDIKNETNEIEMYFKTHRTPDMPARPVNIDPGYLTRSKVVLASTKDYSHRIYIGKGIYAEVTLYYKNRSYRPLPYTYPDYRSGEYIEMFNMARGRLFR